MRSLAQRKTRLIFETEDAVFERGESRQIIVEARPAYCYVRLKGSRRRFPICYAAIYKYAALLALDEARREKAAKRKKAGKR